jgi:hypothetical protein
VAHEQFPDSPYVKTFNTGITEKLAKFTVDKDLLLKYIVLSVLKNGTSVGAESMTLKIYSSWDLTKPVIVSSSARLLSATGAANAQSWIGRLRFDFSGYPLTEGEDYYLRISTTSYTRTPTFYIGALLDWPDTVYTQTRDPVYGAQIRIIGHSERSNDMAVGGEVRQVEIAEGTEIDAPSDITVPAPATALPVQFNPYPGAAPITEVEAATLARVMRFVDGGTEKAVAFIKIPQTYVTGTPISLFIALYSVGTSTTVKLASNTYLVEKNLDAMADTTDVHASTNAALTLTSPAYRYMETELNLTDGGGLINSKTVVAGDTLRVEISRDSATDTSTDDIRFVPDLSEVRYDS